MFGAHRLQNFLLMFSKFSTIIFLLQLSPVFDLKDRLSLYSRTFTLQGVIKTTVNIYEDVVQIQQTCSQQNH